MPTSVHDPTDSLTTTADGPEHADEPTDISAEGWLAVAKRVVDRLKTDHVALFAAGVAFFAFLATIPGMIALVSIYGLFGDASAVERRVDDLAGTLPAEARDLIVQQLESITASSGSALTLGLVVSIGVALWSASSGMGHLIEAVNVAYRLTEQRGFLARRALALVFTLGAVLFIGVVIGVITALPAVLAAADLPSTARWAISLAVWPLIGVGMAIGLALLYRFGPNREPDPRWTWVTPGAIVAVVGWLLASIAFQIYAANFGTYNETYGSLAAVVVLLLWLWISALMVLIGAETNSELERQTSASTTE